MVFWVRLDQENLVGRSAERVAVGNNIVGRTTVNGELIGGRVYTGNNNLFLGALDGIEYTSQSGVFEVHVLQKR